MKVVRIRAIDGPNLYIHRPVLVMRLDLEDFTEKESYEFPGFCDRLLRECPGLFDHYCAMGRPGGFVERLYGGTYMGHVVEHVCLEFLTRIGCKANFGKTRNAGEPHLYDIVIEYEAESVTRFLLETAVEYVSACARDLAFPLADRLNEAGERLAEGEWGPSTAALVRAARERGIPVRRIGSGSLVQLGTGCHRKLLQATLTERASAIATDIASDKELTKQILRSAGIPVPAGGVAQTAEEARRLFARLNPPVVVKPLDGCQGIGVSLHVRWQEELDEAFFRAKRHARAVVVEEQAEGRQYRLLVVGGRLVAAAQRLSARVTGDGRHTVEELIALENGRPERGDDHERPLTRIRVDTETDRCLRREGLSLEDVPAAGTVVLLRDGANLSTGGTAIDVTDEVHPAFAAMAVRAAQAIGLDVCGVDVIAASLGLPLREAGCRVIEVNAAPGIRMHLHPSQGVARDVAATIVESLYPKGARSRVPIVSVTGTNGKTTTTRMVAHILRESGLRVGMTTTDGITIDGQRVLEGDTTGPESARLVLSDPAVEAAALETARGGIMRAGLAYDAADVGIVTNVALDHIGQDGLRTIEDIVNVKSLVVECVAPNGLAVLSADTPELLKLVPRLKSRIALVSVQPDNAAVRRHLSRGGVAYFAREGWLVEAAGALEWQIVRDREIPVTLGGAARFHVANALCAIAAARHLGVSRALCARALNGFRPDVHNPGRVNVFRLPSGLQVITDYGHNPDGVAAMGELARRLWDTPVPAVIGFPGDRADELIRAGGRMAARYFAPLYVKEDVDTRGRRRGEVARLIVEGIREENPALAVHVIHDECEALAEAIDMRGEAPFVFMFHEKLEPVRALLAGREGSEYPAVVHPARTAEPVLSVI